jgi:hypothetical protein
MPMLVFVLLTVATVPGWIDILWERPRHRHLASWRERHPAEPGETALEEPCGRWSWSIAFVTTGGLTALIAQS